MSKKAVVVIERDWEPRHKTNFWFLVTLAVLVLVLAGSAFLVYWYNSNDRNVIPAAPELAELRQQLEFLTEENERLALKLAKAERSVAIDQEAGASLQQTIIEREDEVKKLREELTFYKSIVDPETKQKGITIREFQLTSGTKDRQYRYKLVAAQSTSKKSVAGKVVIRIQGREGEKVKTLDWSALAVAKEKAPQFRFQYYQKLEGVFKVPKGFEPEHILIKLAPSRGKVEAIQQSYSWETAFRGNDSK